MVNIERLRETIDRSGVSISHIAAVANMDRSTLYRRLGSSGEGFTIAEATAISRALNLSSEDVTAIFFDETVA